MTELTKEKNNGAIVEYSFVEERLAELREKYATIPDVEEKDGYEFVRKGIRELVTCRSDIEKKRKEIKAPVIERSKLIDAEAKRITAALVAIEEPLKKAKAVVDDRVAREKAEAERIERERVEAIERTIANFDNVALQAAGQPSTDIARLIEQAEAYEVKEHDFAEFTERARLARQVAIDRLCALRAQAEQAEENQRIIEAQRAELERQRAEIEAARAALEAEKASAQTAAPLQTTADAAADLKDGIVKTEGEPINEETPEEQAAKTLAFTCALGNEKAREVVAMIKTGNVPFLVFSENI